MKTHTQGFKEEIKLLGKQQDIKITYILNDEQIELTSEDINSVTPYYEGNLLKSIMKQLDIDSNKDIPIGAEIRFKYGLLVNGEYEYLDYGNYIVYTSEKQEDTGSYSIVCYDKMLYFMKDYESLGLTYPVTVREYITALCTKLGLTFKNANDTFPNYDKQLTSDLFEGIGFTYRDVADDLSEVTASTICLDINDEVELRDINTVYELEQKSGNPIHINDSIEAPLQHFKLNGGDRQESRSGSNLYNLNDTKSVSSPGVEVDEDDFITLSSDNTDGTSTQFINYFTAKNEKLKANTKYYGVLEVKAVSGVGTFYVTDQLGNQPQTQSKIAYNLNNITNGSKYKFNFTTLEDFTDCICMFRTFLKLDAGQSGSITFRLSVFESDPDLDAFEYEKYGVMPSPEYPSKVETVGSNVNLFDKDNANTVNAYFSPTTNIASNSTAKILYIPCNSNTIYTVSKVSSKRFGIGFTDDIPSIGINILNPIEDVKGGTSLTQTSTSTSKYLCVYYYKSDIDTLTEQEILDSIKIEKGSKATPYSPYGMGSVEIESVNKNFIKIQEMNKTEIGLNISTNKNVVEIKGTSTSGTNIYNFFEDTKLKKGTYTFSFRSENAPAINSCLFAFRDINNNGVLNLNGWGETNVKTITLEEDTIISGEKSSFYTNKNTTFNNTKYELQIEKGKSATEIIEPQSQTQIMYTQQEMLEGDYIEDVEHHEWGKYIFTGNENITTFSSANSRIRYVYSGLQNSIKKPTGSTELVGLLCNYYKEVTALNTYNNIEGISVDENGQLIFKNEVDITVEEFKILLAQKYAAGTPVIVYYKLATPIDLELTEEQEEAREGLNTYKNITNISVDNELATLDIIYATSVETIDEEYLKDTNVNFGEKYGPINSIVLSRAESDNVYLQDEESIQENGLCELKIKDNQIMNFNDRSDYLPDILNKLKGIEFYLNDFTSTGIMYFELLDRYNVKVGEMIYSCVMFNDEQDITQGLEEQVYTEIPETGKTDYTKADKTDQKINQTNLIVDKQNQQIQGLITQIGDRSEKETSITADIDGLTAKVEDIEDVTDEVTGTKIITLENCVAGNLLELHIYGNNTVFDYLLPSDTLFPSDTLYPKGDSRISVINYPINSEEGTETGLYELGVMEVLRQNGDVCDEYVLKDGQAQIIRRINKDGTVKATETIEDLGTFSIPLLEGDNQIIIKNYSANMYAKWAIKNDYTDVFATKVEMNSSITQTAQEINLEVSKKVDENEIISSINQSAEQIQINANKISLKRKRYKFNWR